MATIKETTDAAAGINTTYKMLVGDVFEGVLDDRNDKDWVSISLKAGVTYEITLTGRGDANQKSKDPILRLFDSKGALLRYDNGNPVQNDDIDQASGNLDSKLSYTPKTTGVYYIEARSYANNPNLDNSGAYTIRVKDTITTPTKPGALTRSEGSAASEDAAADTGTAYKMAPGDVFVGTLSSPSDEDWIRIGLTRGQTYEITLSGRGASPAKAEDPILKLLDAKGSVVAVNDDIDLAKENLDSRIVFTAKESATYYISASSYVAAGSDNSGGYTIRVKTVGPDATPTGISGVTLTGGVITGTNASNTLLGTELGERLNGLGGNDFLYGRGGTDVLDGGDGNDTLIGGAEGDELIGGSGADTASYEGSSTGVVVRLHDRTARDGDAQGDIFNNSETFRYTESGRSVTAQLPDIIHLKGSAHGDILAGDQRANTLSGGAGNDTLFGGPGGDSKNQDTLYGQAGDDNLYGGVGDDNLEGGAGEDVLYGGPDDDDLDGGSGDDFLYGGDDDDTLDGNAGDDELYGNDDDDTLDGGDGEDELYGGDDDDDLDGGDDDDELDGGDDDDTLDGGEGDDTLTGGDGDDTFVFSRNSDGDEDTILDFTPDSASGSESDQIDLSAFNITGNDNTAKFNTLKGFITYSRGDATIDLSTVKGGQITLENISNGDLAEADFIFAA